MSPSGPSSVFMTGATGYMGRALSQRLVGLGRVVHGLVRPGSEARLAAGVEHVRGNALDAATYAAAIPRRSTFVHLIGTPHPGPSKAQAFREVDLASVAAAITAAKAAEVAHFVYVSVAQPAPVMRAYVQTRIEAERLLRDGGFPLTVLRPWYVLGPGHRWPLALLPVYALLEHLPPTRAGALRLGMVTLEAMVTALTEAIAHPPANLRVLEVPDIRKRWPSSGAALPIQPLSL